MRIIQLILDVEVSDEALTAKNVLDLCQREGGYLQLQPGLRVRRAVALPLAEPVPAAVPSSLPEWPNASARLVNAARRAKLFTVAELAANLRYFKNLRTIGDGTMKEAIRICVDARASFNVNELELSQRTYAWQLLREQSKASPPDGLYPGNS